MTEQDLSAFLDGVVPYAIRRADIAGATVAVVADGKILFTKGYGYADMKTRAPVVPDRTLFRPGSISKLFTWTAVMQLVQAGKIDLDADINKYLDFKIPEKFGKPITMRNVMTHTAGFGETIAESFVESRQQMQPLRSYLIKHMPDEIYPPGKVTAYSNYGATLAGYIVQRLSGEPFDTYIARHIFQPLGMKDSTFAQPLPAGWEKNIAKGYLQASDTKPFPFEYIEVGPAGSLTSTATDMAHFMIAQLGDGHYQGAPILSPATLRLMHSPQSRMAPGANGFALGFYQENRNGLRIVGHGGDTNVFHSDLHLLLDKNVGFFISFNSQGQDGAAEPVRVEIFRAFLDRYFPYTPPEQKTVANPQRDAARVAGWYGTSRRIASALQVVGPLTQSSVTALPDGEIQASMLTNLAGTPKRWREVGPLTYREVGGQSHLRFVADSSGNVSYWISDDFPPVFVFEKLGGLTTKGNLEWMFPLFATVLLLTLAIWIGGWFVRRRVGSKLELDRLQTRLRLASRLGILAYLAMLMAWALVLKQLMGSAWSLDRPDADRLCAGRSGPDRHDCGSGGGGQARVARAGRLGRAGRAKFSWGFARSTGCGRFSPSGLRASACAIDGCWGGGRAGRRVSFSAPPVERNAMDISPCPASGLVRIWEPM